jgi:hypothetical protein
MATGAISGSAGGGGGITPAGPACRLSPGQSRTLPAAALSLSAVGRYCCYYRYRMLSAAALLRCALCVSRKGPPMASVPCPASKPCARTLSWRPPHGPRKAQRRPAPLLRPKGAKERRLWLWHQRSGPLGSRLSTIHSRARGLRGGGGGCARSLYTRSLLLFARERSERRHKSPSLLPHAPPLLPVWRPPPPPPPSLAPAALAGCWGAPGPAAAERPTPGETKQKQTNPLKPASDSNLKR